METLLDNLYTYAMEHRIDPYLRADGRELRDTQQMQDNALSALRAMDARAADCAERLESSQSTLLYLHCRAGFLAGLSVGLALGRI